MEELFNQLDVRQSAAAILGLASALDIPAMIAGRNLAVIGCNAEYCKTFGIDPDGVVDCHILELLPSLRGCETARSLLDASRALGTYYAEGSVASMFLDATIISKDWGIVLLHRDGNDRRRFDNEQWKLLDSLAHAFRTPLSSIRGYAETICLNPELDGEKTREYISDILRLSVHLNQVVSDLLYLSRLERSGFPEPVEPTDMSRILRDVIETREELLHSKQMHISIEFGDCACMAMGNVPALREITYNLIDNAIKYTPEQGRVEIHLSCREGMVELQIADNGIGIAAEELQFIFDRFFRSGQVRRGDYLGVGLGLSKVKSVLDALGGTIEVANRIGGGTSFTVCIPAA